MVSITKNKIKFLRNINQIIYADTKHYQKIYKFKLNNLKGHDTWNCEADAFKHAYGSALIALKFSNSISILIGLTHEIDGHFHNQPLNEENMDMWNNYVGREVAREIRREINIEKYPVTYGNNIKVIECLLNQKYMSLDGVQSFMYDATNNNILTSKGSFYTWNKEIYNKFLGSEYEKIKEELLNSLVLHVDESPIIINGERYYLHNVSNGTHTLQYVTKHRSQEDIDEFGFLKRFKGIIIHDHYMMYYNYGSDNAECNVHVLRYLNGVTEFTNHKWAKKLKELLLEMKDIKDKYISDGKDSMPDDEYNKFKERYLEILGKGQKERLKDLKTNSYKEEEIKLLNRLIKYADNHLLFLKKFFVPFSNNQAEADLRGIKIKQKTGKFRSLEGANIYAVIKSCLSTYKKNNINLYEAILRLLDNNPVLI